MGEFLKLNRNIQLRILIMFITVAIGSSVGPNMTIYYIEYFGPLVIGILLIIVQLSGFLAGLYGGHLSDLWGRKKVMLNGISLMVVGYSIAASMNSPFYVNPDITFLGFLMAAVGLSFASPAEEAMRIDVSTVKNRKFIYAIIYCVINLSIMIGAALGGCFFKTARFELLVGTAIGAFISWLIVWLCISETLTFERLPEQGKSVMTRLFTKWSGLKSSLVGTAIQGCSFAIMFLLTDFWPLLIFTILLTIGEMIVTPASQSLRAEMMNPEKIGVYSGFSSATRPIGYIISSGIVSVSVIVGNVGAAILLMTMTAVSMLFTWSAVIMLNNKRIR